MLWLMLVADIVANVQFHWAGLSTVVLLLSMLVPNMLVGYWDELVFRGYLLQKTPPPFPR